MCGICERIQMIQNHTNPYFVMELETGYVVMGDHQRIHGYTLFHVNTMSLNFINWI